MMRILLIVALLVGTGTAAANTDYCVWVDSQSTPPAGVHPENCGPGNAQTLVHIQPPPSPVP